MVAGSDVTGWLGGHALTVDSMITGLNPANCFFFL